MDVYRVLYGFIFLFTSVIATANEVGHTPGSFSVGKHGEALYHIPIVVPIGAAGLQPDLGLAYNSHAGNGPLGIGWSLSGLSGISRCQATIAQDQEAGAIRYDTGDRFCLDGARLMVINGEYGAHNSRYRTEIESFQDIYAYDDDNDGHIDKFLLRDKTGLTRFYGYDAASRIEAQGKVYAQSWMLNRIADKSGNRIDFEYTEQTGAGQRGEHWIQNIYYRNRNSQNLGRVEFHYDTGRQDKRYGYSYGGSRLSAVVRLNRVDIYGHDQNDGWSRARQYRLGYEQNISNGVSQLTDVQQCNATGSHCLAPTRMNYFHGENGIHTDIFATLPSHISNQFMDVNGDGRLDQVYELDYRWTIRLAGSHEVPRVSSIDSHPHARDSSYTRVLDYNGDGKQDLLVANTTTGRWNILESNGSGFVQRDTGKLHFDAHQRRPLIVDLDGDGLPEILFKRDGWLEYYQNDGGNFTGPIHTDFKVTGPQVLTPLEYDGDGRLDIVVNLDGCSGNDGPIDPPPPWHPHGKGPVADRTLSCNETAGILTWSVSDNALVALPMTGYTDTADIGGTENYNQLLDFNGDGLTDLAVAPTTDNGQWRFYVNRGGMWQFVWSGHHGDQRDQVTVFDFDGDGRQELWQPSNGLWYRLRPSITDDDISFFAIASGTHTGDRSFFADFSGDGQADLITSDGGDYHVRAHRGSQRGLLKSIENGLGDETQVAYIALSDQEAAVIYAGETGTPVFPDRHVRSATYLVRSVAADNGLLSSTGSDFKVVTNYTYHGAKLNLHGRGFLGFSKIEAHNVNTQIVTYNSHSQSFPYTGLITRAEQWTPEVDLQAIDWRDIDDDFAPCQAGSGPCTQPRSTADQTRGGKGTGSVVQQRNPTIPAEKLSETVNTLSHKFFDVGGAGQRYAPFVSSRTELQLEYRSTDIIRRTVTQTTHDDYGNPTSIVITVDDGTGGSLHRVSTENSYANWDDARWCLGRLISTTVDHQRTDYGSGGPLGTERTSSFVYDNTTCQLIQEVIEPDSDEWRLQKDYEHDIFGNRSAVTVSGPDVSSRITRTDYDAFGQFPVSLINPLGHVVSNTWDYTLGHKLSTTDVNGFVSTLDYDELGRVVRETAPRSSIWAALSSAWCQQSACAASNAVFKTIRKDSSITVTDQVKEIVEFDQLGREVSRQSRAFDGRFIHVETHFDAAGRSYAVSTPHFANEVACWAISEFDNIGRLVAEHKPIETQDCLNYGPGVPDPANHTAIDHAYGGLTTYEFNGLETTITDAAGREVSRTVNVMDRLKKISEFNDAGDLLETYYDYDPLGNSTWVRDANGNVSTTEYNLRGLKVGTNDPDLGYWEYRYNTLGELIWQQDANEQITTLQYDLLGRITGRFVAEGPTQWYYDNPALENNPDYHGASIGRLTRVTGPDAFEQRLRYAGQYGELTQKIERLDGTWYHFDWLFDAAGRVSATLAPAVGYSDPGAAQKRLRLETSYNEYGFPYLVREYRDQALRYPLWRAMAMDALGHVIEEKTHNDTVTTQRDYDRASTAQLRTTAGINGAVQNEAYQWDSAGNLTARADLNRGWTERFFYDSLYRLNQVRLATADDDGFVTALNQYDAIGNIRCKDAIRIENGSCVGGYREYSYGAVNSRESGDAGPHAMTRVLTTAGERIYDYDNNGNLVSVNGGGTFHIADWYSYNKLKAIWRKNHSAEFWYRPGERTRWKQRIIQGAQLATTYYVGGLYERRARDGEPDEHTYYLQANGRVVGQIKRYGNTVTASTEQYFHRDHLGSIVAVTDQSGQVLEQMSYDAWGKRRHVSNWTVPGGGNYLSATETQRGYTGHEHIDDFGLINMNGRVYDVETGRFLSADPFVQYPDSTQGYNRYAYVNNNPQSFSDPSGFFIKGLIARIVGALVTGLTGQAWLGQLVQGYLSSGGDLKAMSISLVLGNSLGQRTQMTLQTLRAGINARKNGGHFITGVLGALKNQVIGIVEGIGQTYLMDTGAKIARSIKADSTSGTGTGNEDGRGAGTTNGAETDAFDNAAKIEFEAELGVRVKDWLEIAVNNDGEFFAKAGGKTISIKLDDSGNLVFSAGNVSTSIEIEDFDSLTHSVRDSFNIDLSVLGGSLAVADTGDISWKAYIKTSGLLGKLGIRGKMGLAGTFDPSNAVRNTAFGQAGLQYRRGTTRHVDECLASNFVLEGC